MKSKKSQSPWSFPKIKSFSLLAKSNSSRQISKSQYFCHSVRQSNNSTRHPESLPRSILRLCSEQLKKSETETIHSEWVESLKINVRFLVKEAAVKATFVSQSCLLLMTLYPQFLEVLTKKSRSKMQKLWKTSSLFPWSSRNTLQMTSVSCTAFKKCSFHTWVDFIQIQKLRAGTLK